MRDGYQRHEQSMRYMMEMLNLGIPSFYQQHQQHYSGSSAWENAQIYHVLDDVDEEEEDDDY